MVQAKYMICKFNDLTTKGRVLLKETANYIVARGYPSDRAAAAIHERQMIVQIEELTEYHRVYVGSTAELCDTAAEGEPASLVIMQFRSNNPRGMDILKL